MQRGNFSDPGQFKIQLDHGVPSCRIVGDAGEVFVEAQEAVEPEAWYAVSCEREGSEVSLTVTPYDDQEDRSPGAPPVRPAPSRCGAQPLVRGRQGRVREGVPVASADQFNGAVDDVFLRID